MNEKLLGTVAGKIYRSRNRTRYFIHQSLWIYLITIIPFNFKSIKKDPMVFHYDMNKQRIMYFLMMKDYKHWVVEYITSVDLVNWDSPEICFNENT